MKFNPHPYQERALQWVIDNPRSGLFLDMGLGKTISVLMAIDDLIYNAIEIKKVLVIAPLRVARSTWSSEIEKWDNVSHLRYSIAVGSERQRLDALNKEADIYIINRDNVTWLIDNYPWDFDMCVIDELSSFKSTKSLRFKKLRKVAGMCKRVVGLTGTPAPNGLIDLWAQVYLLDGGKRLGKTISQFRNIYFKPGRSNGYVVYDYVILPKSEERIYDKLSDICLSMKKEDHLDMPDRIYNMVSVELDKKAKEFYRRLEKDAIIELSANEVVLLSTAAVASNKLQQVANGAVYTEDKKVLAIHDHKLDALEDLIESANGQPVIVFYQYKHDKSRIQERFETFELNTDEDIKKWNSGKVPILLAHPASIGHGLNLQAGGHIIIWFGLTWNLEHYLQANDRVYRQGQEETVIIYHLVTKGTVDERIVKALENKEKGQDALMEYMKDKITEYAREEQENAKRRIK